jgi:glucose-1-phosphate cytidylyltransferase
MKVVLFCGGLGMRLREYSENVPKPMVPIGYRPIIWHLMKYYAFYGHKDFVLCLGYKADTIKDYFLNYDECVSNDFVLDGQSGKPTLLNSDIQDWKITFVDTGVHSNIGMRLKAVRRHLEGEEVFMANYADGLSDLPLPSLIDYHRGTGKIASFLCVSPAQSFHAVTLMPDGQVTDICDLSRSGININGGFFVFRKEIFDHMRDGEELVHEPFKRLIETRQLTAYPYKGFWASMDTFKDKQRLDDLHSRGDAPWEIWRRKELEQKVRAVELAS